MATIGFVFAPLAPLVTVMACAVFWSKYPLPFMIESNFHRFFSVSSIVYKYQLMFVFVTRVESGGVSIFGITRWT